MSVFLYQTSRLLNSIKDVEDLTDEDKREHAFNVLCEWPLAREQLHLSDIYDPNLGIHLGDKLWTNQQYSALKVYKTRCFNWRHFRKDYRKRWNVEFVFDAYFISILTFSIKQPRWNWKRTTTFSSKSWQNKKTSIPDSTSETRSVKLYYRLMGRDVLEHGV